jgi:alkylation response protein AidB-like acyl-CoA dehydrogenase
MDLRDTAEQAAFRTGLRDWLRRHRPPAGPRSAPPSAPPAAPPAARWAEDPRHWGKLLHEAGYAGLTWPTESGGAGLPASYQGIFAEECALAGAPDHHNVIGLNMVGPTLIRYGTASQRERHLGRILSGEHLFCQGFSEPDAGSDLAAVRTRATTVDGGFVVTGEKLWSSYAQLADYCLLLARTDPQAARHAGLTCFLLDMRAPGVTVRPLRMITGDADFGQIILDEVRLPAETVVGEVGAGWQVALTTLAHERGTFGITLTARLAVQFERLLATVRAVGAQHDPVVRQTVAQLYVDLEALRQTGYRALATVERTGAPGPESSVLKLHWSHTHQRLVAFAASLADGASLAASAWAAYWQRERLRSRGNTIEGGTSEILRGIIAERVAGLPRSR